METKQETHLVDKKKGDPLSKAEKENEEGKGKNIRDELVLFESAQALPMFIVYF